MTEITQDMVEAHGLAPDEYERLLGIIGREPTFTELGIFSAMWNEHCSYKSSKVHLRTLPTEGPQVICGPGENAGVVDIGDGQAVVFKMESHNHPSYIEPYQGAATGMGGILRDVFTMGARPVAAMNALSFGRPDHPRTRSLLAGVVAGIGGYGNAFGVPTVGGQLRFDAAYDGNCLVNAFAAGIADADAIFYSAASGVGRPVVYLGAKTGRDGVGGATMASAEFDDTIEEKRPTVQVGDPFTEKKLMEATLELMATGAVVSIQDMGAAGLTCSAVEMGDKGRLGIRLDLDAVPVRERDMTAYEMMLSESQERMLMVLDPALEAEARAVFEKWDLDFAIVGETIPEDRFLVVHGGETVADLPLSTLASSAPEYARPWEETPARKAGPIPEMDIAATVLALVTDPTHAHKAWVWEQYDTTVMADTLVPPGRGAGVIRVHGTRKALAFASAVTPRYVEADPATGGAQAVAEAARLVRAKGAVPLAVTDNLNFGNPEKPRIMGQLALAVRGIGAACEALGTPVVSGNVSLYNETDGTGILPTPTIGAVGLVRDYADLIPQRPSAGDVLVEIGGRGTHLHCSAVHRDGPPPPVDLAAESRTSAFVSSRTDLTACASIGSGGLFLAAFAMAATDGLGVAFDDDAASALFGEDQGRFVAATSVPDTLIEAARAAGVEARIAGRVTQAELSFGGTDADLAATVAAWRGAIPALMDGSLQAQTPSPTSD